MKNYVFLFCLVFIFIGTYPETTCATDEARQIGQALLYDAINTFINTKAKNFADKQDRVLQNGLTKKSIHNRLSTARRMAVLHNIANIRSGPGRRYKVIWQVEKYHPLLVLSQQGEWSEFIDIDGEIAWIHSSALGEINTVITIQKNIHLMSRPNNRSQILLNVNRGVPFRVFTQSNEWFKVQHADGDMGWIAKDMVW